MGEIWKNIEGYEEYNGLYMVSNKGKVLSLRRNRVLKPRRHEKGYYTILFSKNNNQKSVRIHRLVAEAFIPNPKKLPHINHRDEDKTNNNASNLEWCTPSYNNGYGTGPDRREISRVVRARNVDQYTMDGIYVRTYNTIKEASREMGIHEFSIRRVAKGGYIDKRKGKWINAYMAGGYKWIYSSEFKQIHIGKIHQKKGD